jgi:hypothetical protein
MIRKGEDFRAPFFKDEERYMNFSPDEREYDVAGIHWAWVGECAPKSSIHDITAATARIKNG